MMRLTVRHRSSETGISCWNLEQTEQSQPIVLKRKRSVLRHAWMKTGARGFQVSIKDVCYSATGWEEKIIRNVYMVLYVRYKTTYDT
jgi:hypothetical protein